MSDKKLKIKKQIINKKQNKWEGHRDHNQNEAIRNNEREIYVRE